MSDIHNRSQSSARRGDYVWQYEYYDDEEPVSFEGLRAHRYSIVIGFWVGLAVFVIFMFFVLTLLTKTGAPHQENPDSGEKRQVRCPLDIDGVQDETEKVFSRPLLEASRSYFHFYINEEDGRKDKQTDTTALGNAAQQGAACRGTGVEEEEEEEEEEERRAEGKEGHRPPLMEEGEEEEEGRRDRECASLSHFNIPNFVNMEQSSTPEEEEEEEGGEERGRGLEYEPPVTPERRSHSQDVHCDIH